MEPVTFYNFGYALRIFRGHHLYPYRQGFLKNNQGVTVHYPPEPLAPGESVRTFVDWDSYLVDDLVKYNAKKLEQEKAKVRSLKKEAEDAHKYLAEIELHFDKLLK